MLGELMSASEKGGFWSLTEDPLPGPAAANSQDDGS